MEWNIIAGILIAATIIIIFVISRISIEGYQEIFPTITKQDKKIKNLQNNQHLVESFVNSLLVPVINKISVDVDEELNRRMRNDQYFTILCERLEIPKESIILNVTIDGQVIVQITEEAALQIYEKYLGDIDVPK